MDKKVVNQLSFAIMVTAFLKHILWTQRAIMLSLPYTLLIVDDEPDICEIVQNYISAEISSDILQIKTTSSAEDAAQIIANEDIHIIITDLNMPKISGYDISALANQNSTIQTIFLTGVIHLSVALTCYKDGAAAMLNKPIDPMKLVFVVENAIARLDIWRETFDSYKN